MNVPESIISAFKEVPYPGDDFIAFDDCPECRQIREEFRGKSSLLLEDGFLERRCDSLPLLSAAAFHYFLPAYLLYSLRHPDSDVAFCTFQGLGMAGLDAIDLDRFRRFSRQQRGAVIAFLEFFNFHEIESDDEDNLQYQNKLDTVIKIWKKLPST
jgi:hypothetical protein